MNELPDDPILVVGGGGIKGIATTGIIYNLYTSKHYIKTGVLMVFEKAGLLKKIRTFAGSSIGAFVCMLHCIGYTPNEITDVMMNARFDRFINDINFHQLIEEKHLCQSEWLKEFIDDLIQCKQFDPKTLTLQTLYEKTKKEIVVTTVNRQTGFVLLLERKSFPNELLSDAIYRSMCVPR